MTKKQAEKEVQKLLAHAEGLLQEAAKLMDEHGFTTRFKGLDYIPNGLEYKEDSDGYCDDPPLGFYFEEGKHAYEEHYAGEWKSSSDWRGC